MRLDINVADEFVAKESLVFGVAFDVNSVFDAIVVHLLINFLGFVAEPKEMHFQVNPVHTLVLLVNCGQSAFPAADAETDLEGGQLVAKGHTGLLTGLQRFLHRVVVPGVVQVPGSQAKDERGLLLFRCFRSAYGGTLSMQKPGLYPAAAAAI